MRFYVEADGTELWRSETISSGQSAVPFSVNIEGARTLVLGVDPLRNIDCDEAVWVNPILR